jgi:hypothetical protein
MTLICSIDKAVVGFGGDVHKFGRGRRAGLGLLKKLSVHALLTGTTTTLLRLATQLGNPSGFYQPLQNCESHRTRFARIIIYNDHSHD